MKLCDFRRVERLAMHRDELAQKLRRVREAQTDSSTARVTIGVDFGSGPHKSIEIKGDSRNTLLRDLHLQLCAEIAHVDEQLRDLGVEPDDDVDCGR